MPTDRKERYLTAAEFAIAQKEAKKIAQKLIDAAKSTYRLLPQKNPSLDQILEVAANEPFNIRPNISMPIEDKLADIIFPTRNQPAGTRPKSPAAEHPHKTSSLPTFTLPSDIRIR